MRKSLMALGVTFALAGATPAFAHDSASQISMVHALDIATRLGLVTVSNTDFDGDEWDIEGRDVRGRYMEVSIDAATGAVRNVDR